jgi:flagella basal body P-ring formation protein FlgA
VLDELSFIQPHRRQFDHSTLRGKGPRVKHMERLLSTRGLRRASALPWTGTRTASKYVFWCVLAVVSTACGAAEQASPPPRLIPVTLRDAVQSTGGPVTLRQIADAEPACDAWLWLSHMTVAEIGSPSVVLTREQITDVLRRKMPDDWQLFWDGAAAVEIRGAANSRIAPPTNQVQLAAAVALPEQADIGRSAEEYSAESFGSGPPRWLIAQLDTLIARAAASSSQPGMQCKLDWAGTIALGESWRDVRRAIAVRPAEEIRSGSSVWEVQAIDVKGNHVTVSVAVVVEQAPTCLALKHPVERGRVIFAADLTAIVCPVQSGPTDYLVDSKAVVGLQAVRALSADRPLRQADFAQPTLVERGELVDLRVRSGGITLKTVARALTGGARGDSIMLETAQKKRVSAIVTDAGVAEINPDLPTRAANMQ